jgi:predicted permease
MLNPALWYRLLLHLFPVRFREQYQTLMERQFQDEYREARGWRGRVRLWLRALWDLAISVPGQIVRELGQDLRYGLRVYRSRTLSASLAIAALALAIGASTGVFTVLNALLIRGLPFANADRLVEIQRSPVTPFQGRAAFMEWGERSLYLESAAAFSSLEMNLAGDHAALRVRVAETSANLFKLLGTRAGAGRTFTPDEDAPGRTDVAVISHGLWQQLFGENRDALGSTLRLNGTPVTIIGVAPPHFDYPGKTSVWLATAFDFERVPKHGAFYFRTLGRLKPEVTRIQAQGLFEAEAARLDPKSLSGDDQNRARLIPMRDHLAGPIRQATWVLCGIVLCVLLAACANVAQLLLSRTTERQRELTLRAALGASRARLVQQLITEAMALTTLSAALGLLIALWVSRLAASVAPPELATQEYRILDWMVLGFATGLTIVIGILFGVIPAWLVGRLQPSAHLVRTQTGRHDPATRRMRIVLLGLQAALSVTLLAGSLAMVRTFLNLLDADLGFRTNHVVTVSVSLQGSKLQTSAARQDYYTQVLHQLRALPAVEATGGVGYLPLAVTAVMSGTLKMDSGQQIQGSIWNGATPEYFRAIGTSLIAGRDFLERELHQSERTVIVNNAFASQAGLGASVVGRKLIAPWRKEPYLIIGVVDNARIAGPAYPVKAQVYWPVAEEPPVTLTFVARVRGEAEKSLASCLDTVRGVDREVSVYDAKTQEQRLREVLARPRFYTTATLFFASLAVLLAAIGIYGSASYLVAQRTHEMGVRLALGASRVHVRSMIVRESLTPIAMGAVGGIVGAILSGRYLEHLVVNAKPLELPHCLMAAAFLLATAAAAVWTATAGVLRIDPMDALRAE